MFPDRLAYEIRAALTDLAPNAAGAVRPDDVPVERPFDTSWGDFASPVALRLARSYACSPRHLAGDLAARVRSADGIAGCEVAGEGFLNVRLDAAALVGIVRAVVVAGRAYGADPADTDPADTQPRRSPAPDLVRDLRYAHVRMVALLRAGRSLGVDRDGDRFDPEALADVAPRRLVCALAEYPRIVRHAPARAFDSYLHELLSLIVRLEGTRRIIPVGDTDPTPAHAALLLLVDATRTVLDNALHRCGISAPERL